jgi:hypothetical protein
MGRKQEILQCLETITDQIQKGMNNIEMREMRQDELAWIEEVSKQLADDAYYETMGKLRALGYI